MSVVAADAHRPRPKTMSELGHERRFRDVHNESGLPSTPERLRHRSEPTLRAKEHEVTLPLPESRPTPPA
jgi:hypothetical protein